MRRALVAAFVSGALLTIGAVPVVLADRLQMTPSAPAEPRQPPRVPIGYAPQPEGTPLRLVGSPRIDGPGLRMTVSNIGVQPIVGLTYVAIVERVPFTQPVVPLDHDFGAMSLQPGQTITLSAQWLNAQELDRLLATSPGRVQIFLAPNRIRFGDNTEWAASIDPTATDHQKALRRPPPLLPRSLVGAPAPASAATDGLCRDDLNRGYSPGAVIEIRDEPKRSARCVNRQWIDTTR